jgi:pimeloyl-ACP methyl ester carboxylesterase
MPTTTTLLSELHHEVRGSGPPVLFISGASGDAGHFGRTAERLAGEFTTVTYDRRGNSRSAVQARPMSIGSQADDAAALIEGLGLQPAIAFGTSGGGDILLELIARRPDVLRGAVVHEPALRALADPPDPREDELGLIVALAARDPRAAMEAFLRMHTSDATFESLDPKLRERVLGNGAHFFGNELGAFASYVPDNETIVASGVALRLLRSDEGTPPLIQATERFAVQIGVAVETVFGNHAPYLQRPEAFADELRPILRELV